MASEVDPVVLELRAENGKYLSALRQSTTAVDAALGRQQKQVQSLENQFRKSSGAIAGQLKTLAAGFAGAFSVRELGSVIDSFTRLQNNLRVSGLEGEKLAGVQNELLDLSTRYGASIEGLSSVFLKASLAQQSLGASTEDIIRLNEVVAASLKVTGTSATEAQGALLQLGQALGSGVVRAEEFNSILEGAFPLAQAAARGIEGFAGDVAKLRIAIADGKVSSQEFFEGVLRGGVQTIEDAKNATLTLSGAFTALGSQFTVYIGEGAKANGITQALSSAIMAIADNINTIIPALAVIVGLIGVKYVAATAKAIAGNVAFALSEAQKAVAVNASNAALARGTGLMIANTQATAAGTAATLGFAGAARTAGTALVAAFGGPWGIVITGLTAAIVGLGLATRDTAQSLGDLEQELLLSTSRMEDAEKQAKDAGVNIDKLASATDTATDSTSSMVSMLWKSVDVMVEATKRTKELTLAKLALSSAEANKTIAELTPRVTGYERAEAVESSRYNVLSLLSSKGKEILEDNKAQYDLDKARLNLAKQIVAQNERTKALIESNAQYVDPVTGDRPSAPSASSAATGGKKKGRRGGRADDPLDAVYAESQRLRDAIMDETEARLQLATSAEDRSRLEFELLGLERDQQNAALDEAFRKKDIGEAEYNARKEILDKLYGQAKTESETGDILVQAQKSLYGEMILRREREQTEREATELANLEHGMRQDALRHEYDMTAKRADRLRLAKEMIDGDIEFRRQQLQIIKDNEDLSKAQRERARIALENLDNERRRGYAAADADHRSPLEAYRKEISDTANNMNDEYEAIAVSGLKSLNDGLTDAIMNSKNLGDVFKNVSKQIIADLIRIAIQQTIVNSLMGVLSGLFGKGAPVNLLSGTPYDTPRPRASGGHVNAGQIYRVNEAGREFFQPANSGNIIPLGEMNAKLAQSGASGGVVRVIVEEGPSFASTVRAEATGVAVEVVRASAPAIIQAGATEAQRNMTRPTMGRTY